MNLLFVTYCIQKCQKCCEIVRDRVPSLKKSEGTAFPRVPAPLHYCLQQGSVFKFPQRTMFTVHLLCSPYLMA